MLLLLLMHGGWPSEDQVQAQSATEYHVVQRGETLFRIAQRYGVSVQDLRRWNQLSTNQIRVGQRLRIRPPKAEETSAPDSGAFLVHVVQPGETLFRIAQRYGVRVQEIRSWNGLTDDRLRVGQQLRVRSPASIPTSEPGSPETGAERYHIVQPGETLYSIARRYGISPEQLQESNALSDPTLRPGQRLHIPAAETTRATPARSWQTYTVRPGDTLYRIAQQFGMSVEALRQANGLRSDSLRPGDILVVYRSESPAEPTSEPTPAAQSPPETLSVRPTAPPPAADWSHLYESGPATVYGVEMNGPTASGELYDPLKFTCAHPTLPFGTVLMVTNRWNQRSVFVKVNDRPPRNTPAGVILVLSPAAAREIQLLEGQQAPVEIRIVR
jgi:LysM repeat protein